MNCNQHSARTVAQRLVLLVLLLPASSHAEVYESFTEPIRTHEIACVEMGRVADVFVQRGARVDAGDPLLRLDSSLLSASKKLAEAKAKPGAKLMAVEVELAAKTHRLQQLGKLLDEGAGNEEEVRRAIVEADVARLNVESAMEDLELAKLQLGEIEARIAQRLTRSPKRGIVTDVYYEVGEYVSNQSMQCLQLVDISTIRVTFHLPTSLAVTMNEGDAVELFLPESNEKRTAKIMHLARLTEADSGRVRVDITIENESEQVRSGVRCSFDTAANEK